MTSSWETKTGLPDGIHKLQQFLEINPNQGTGKRTVLTEKSHKCQPHWPSTNECLKLDREGYIWAVLTVGVSPTLMPPLCWGTLEHNGSKDLWPRAHNFFTHTKAVYIHVKLYTAAPAWWCSAQKSVCHFLAKGVTRSLVLRPFAPMRMSQI